MEPQDEHRPPKPKLPDFTGWVVLVAVLGLIALGLYVFPLVKQMVNTQDCVASGRTACSRGSGP